MNKDVIYIEPEEDITDILGNIKNAKNKIVALVPPKKAGVLRSAVNFKLIAKTAAKAGKTVVLISSDDSLLRLAKSVEIPTAKTLQSKPQLPKDIEVSELGDDNDDANLQLDVIEEDEPSESANENIAEIAIAAKDDAAKGTESAVAGVARSRKAAEPEEVNLNEEEDGAEAKKSAKKSIKIPNFAKNRKKIIAGIGAVVVLFIFVFWALVIAPAAKITVTVKISKQQSTWPVTFTVKESEVDTENGVFLLEEKTVKLTDSSDFTATGEKDKGEKATGTLSLIRKKGSTFDSDTKNLSIPKGTTFTINGKSYVSTNDASANITADDAKDADYSKSCTITSDYKLSCMASLSEDVTSSPIQIVAKESGDSYNLSANQTGWTTSLSGSYTITNPSAITGGTSDIVKIVTEDDITEAAGNLTTDDESEARSQLADEFGEDYIMIKSSFNKGDTKTTTTPALNEEVSSGVTPKIISETSYSIFAVKAETIDNYITKQIQSSLGDDTQQLYATGAIKNDYSDTVSAYFEKYKASGSTYSAKLVSTYIYGPRITEEMIAEQALGEKIGNVRSKLSSINGVSSVNIETSYFWVTSVPSDPNKVQYEITVE